jgi:hypothetical protein
MPEQETLPKLEDIVTLEKDKVVAVNWGSMNGIKLSYGRFYETFNDEVLRFLKDRGFLCKQSKGAFIVLSDSGMDLSPATSYGTHYGFNTQEDATSFAMHSYSGTFYGVRIAQLVTDNVHKR